MLTAKVLDSASQECKHPLRLDSLRGNFRQVFDILQLPRFEHGVACVAGGLGIEWERGSHPQAEAEVSNHLISSW